MYRMLPCPFRINAGQRLATHVEGLITYSAASLGSLFETSRLNEISVRAYSAGPKTLRSIALTFAAVLLPLRVHSDVKPAGIPTKDRHHSDL
ncbi:hypothetical protein ACVJBD_007444 [Rhizobium mongolense]